MVVAAVTSASEGTAQGVSSTQTDTCPAGFAALAGTAEEQVAVLAAPSLTSGWLYLTIIPRTCVGYELLDSGRGAEHLVRYHKLISNKREWNNCFIKYQTLDKYISNFIFHRLEFLAILREKFP